MSDPHKWFAQSDHLKPCPRRRESLDGASRGSPARDQQLKKPGGLIRPPETSRSTKRGKSGLQLSVLRRSRERTGLSVLAKFQCSLLLSLF